MYLPTALLTETVNNGFVVAMGIGTVFVGLICIILLIKLMSMVTALFTANAPAQAAPAAPAAAPAPAAPAASTAIENRAEIIAAVCAAAKGIAAALGGRGKAFREREAAACLSGEIRHIEGAFDATDLF